MIIYNLFPLLAGTMPNWEGHFRRAADMGFDWIFVNPIQKSGYSGSLYSIVDYFQIDPRLVDGSCGVPAEEQAKQACRQARDLGLKVMVDLVISHCAMDSALTREHREWFLHDSHGRLAHPFCLEKGKKVFWGDLVRFDHEGTSDPEGLYRYILGVVEFLIGLGFSGFRCDAAYQLPARLWERLIAETKGRHPATVFAAETLGCTPEQAAQTAATGFDYIFNSAKWWDFESPWLLDQYELLRHAAPSIGFPESHDTPRLFQEVDGNVNAVKQRFLFTSLFSAGSMIPMGFEFGFRKHLHVVESQPGDWEQPHVDLRDFIRKVNAVKRGHRVFQEECPTRMLACSNPKILLLAKTMADGSEEALLILNKDTRHGQGFRHDNLSDLVGAGVQLHDVSPEHSIGAIAPGPFAFELGAGQGLVLVGTPGPRG
ncbi:MAG: alpha-amylase family glycosyl hydrolase [Rhodocyclaceae bacterium]